MSEIKQGNEIINFYQFLKLAEQFGGKETSGMSLGDRVKKGNSREITQTQQYIELKKQRLTTIEDCEKAMDKIDFDPTKDGGCNVSNENVIMTMCCFNKVSKIVCDETFVSSTISKVREWIETFQGNDQEGALDFFM